MNVIDRDSAVSSYFATIAAALSGLELFFGQPEQRILQNGPPGLHLLPYLDRRR